MTPVPRLQKRFASPSIPSPFFSAGIRLSFLAPDSKSVPQRYSEAASYFIVHGIAGPGHAVTTEG